MATEDVEMVKLTIDGREVEIEEGSTVLHAARKLGIAIPTLCHVDFMEPYGACRVCLVEITRGERKQLVSSCTLPAENGLVVETNNDRVRMNRKLVIEFLLARCSTVPILLELAKEYGIDRSRFGEGKEECIFCGLCTRVCELIVGASAISFVERGTDRRVSTPFGEESDVCITCGACAYVCPTGVMKMLHPEGKKIHHQEMHLGPTTAIRVPTLQAIPNVPFIDKDACIHFRTGACKICEQVCPVDAVDHDITDETEEIETGTIIVASGYKPFDPSGLKQYGYGMYPNVITSVEFEKLCHASGPTGGNIVLEDGRPAQSAAILHCIGSRDENNNVYCSRVCCMYSMKVAHLLREKTEGAVYEFYIDIRAAGKGYEEFYHRMMEEDVQFVRGKGAEITTVAENPDEEGKLVVKCEDTLLGVVRRVPVDLVVLSVGIEPPEGYMELGQTVGLGCSHGGFYMERHPKLAPVSTASDGLFVAGCCQAPKDIPDSVAQGAAAAGQALSLIDKKRVQLEPNTATIDEDLCSGCRVCNALCPFDAIEFDAEKKISKIQEALCKGCGTCVAACPTSAASQMGFTDQQIFAEIEGALASVS
jgi:heterodisulfide reductase subunit A